MKLHIWPFDWHIYLHLTFVHSKCQGQVMNMSTANRPIYKMVTDGSDKKYYSIKYEVALWGFRLAYLDLALPTSVHSKGHIAVLEGCNAKYFGLF